MHKARKRFGQHFLVDDRVVADIICAIRPEPGDNMVEIGPGLGALTRPLLARLDKLHVVEIDRDIIARLENEYPRDTLNKSSHRRRPVSSPLKILDSGFRRNDKMGLVQRFPSDKLIIHAGDALKFDLAGLPAPLRVVGNLPYNISSPLLFHFAGFAARIRDMHFMLQDEVVERMVASPSTPAYGRLSVMLQYRFYMEKLLDVPPEAFRPVPKVNSAVVRMIPLPANEVPVKNESLFAEIVAAAFGQRRKTLRNALRNYLEESDFRQLGIDPGLRAENLGVAEFARMTRTCS